MSKKNFLKLNFSKEHEKFLRIKRKSSLKITLIRLSLILFFIIFWELSAKFSLVDEFLVSSPSRIFFTISNLAITGKLFEDIGVTLLETIVGFILGTLLGIIFAVIIWWSDFVRKIIEPALIVLNALPKVALGPIIIVWIGANVRSIIVMALLVSVIISIINIVDSFKNTDKEKILLMKSFGASKYQILTKLILPASFSVLICTLKINIGMSLIGVITGEFLVASKGIGYLIVYGGQTFKLDLVMAGIVILSIIASSMYLCVVKLEKALIKRR
ncbi:MAG: ABC transporter permease [Oscillospiraceae bacterium]|jgi:NitT/TauT family transport system permease protein|nr:ABC transporter permease [Oscillospiraceae bacterium]